MISAIRIHERMARFTGEDCKLHMRVHKWCNCCSPSLRYQAVASTFFFGCHKLRDIFSLLAPCAESRSTKSCSCLLHACLLNHSLTLLASCLLFQGDTGCSESFARSGSVSLPICIECSIQHGLVCPLPLRSFSCFTFCPQGSKDTAPCLFNSPFLRVLFVFLSLFALPLSMSLSTVMLGFGVIFEQ